VSILLFEKTNRAQYHNYNILLVKTKKQAYLFGVYIQASRNTRIVLKAGGVEVIERLHWRAVKQVFHRRSG